MAIGRVANGEFLAPLSPMAALVLLVLALLLRVEGALAARNFPARRHRLSLQVVTYADHATPQLCASARSAARHGIHLRVLDATGLPPGLDDPRANKPAAMRRFLSSLDGQDSHALLLFADAYDVLFTGPLEAVAVRRIMQAVTAHWTTAVLFSAERNCSPYMDFFGKVENRPGGVEQCARLAQGTHTSFRYINTGSWVATVPAARAFVDSWVEELAQDGEAASDQECVHRLREKLHDTVFIDQDCELFQTGWGTPLERSKSFCLPGVFCLRNSPWRSWVLPNCTVYNTETGTRPSVIHFNGDKRNFGPAAEFCDRLDTRRAATQARLRALATSSPLLVGCL